MRHPDGFTRLIGPNGYDWMAQQARHMDSAMEVGCWDGAGIYALCVSCPGPVYAVDHWQGSPEKDDATHRPQFDVLAKFTQNVGHFPNLRIYSLPSAEAATHFAPQSVDMIFIDAGHDKESIETDLRVWLPVCAKLLCGHDWGYVPVREALEALGRPITHHVADIWSINLGNVAIHPPDPFEVPRTVSDVNCIEGRV